MHRTKLRYRMRAAGTLLALLALSSCAPPAERDPLSDAIPCTSWESGGALDPDALARIELGLLDNCELVIGQARTLEIRLLPGSDRPAPGRPADVLSKQAVTWSSSDSSVISVDPFGRLWARAAGRATVTVTSKGNPGVKAHARFVVKTEATRGSGSSAVLIRSKRPAANFPTLQKLVDRYAAKDSSAEAAAGRALLSGAGVRVTDSVATWEIKDSSATGLGLSYVLRTDNDPRPANRNHLQYFMGNRYLPIDSTVSYVGASAGPINPAPEAPVAIASDGRMGLWIRGAGGSLSHIRMERMDADAKADLMSDVTQLALVRRGQVDATATRDFTASPPWSMGYGDSTPIWTGLYAVGELMRYAVLKRERAPAAMLDKVRRFALASLKHELLLANVTGRRGYVPAKLRIPVYSDDDNLSLSPLALRLGKDLAINVNPFGPTGLLRKSDPAYNLAPLVKEDWIKDPFPWGDPRSEAPTATTVRMIEGLPVRHFGLNGAVHHGTRETGDLVGGNLYKREVNGTAALQKFTIGRFGGETPYLTGTRAESEAPYLADASLPIPDVLACTGSYAGSRCINSMQDETGRSFGIGDVYYKTETSYDGIISLLFTYRVAYDILSEQDPEERGLKDLIRETLRTWALHNIANGYMMVDANGQPNRWTNVSRMYLTAGFNWEDRMLYVAMLMAGMKLAAYVTNEQRFEEEYRALALSSFYDYATLAGSYWSNVLTFARYACPLDPRVPAQGLSCDANDPAFVEEWAREYVVIGDSNHAAQAFYILFTLESLGTPLREKFVQAYEQWWSGTMRFEENPFHAYVRQLGQPETILTDAYGRELLSTVAWGLTRHPIDTTQWSAYDPARPDIAQIGVRDRNMPLLTSAEQNGRARPIDALDVARHVVLPADERSIHTWNRSLTIITGDINPNGLCASTTYTLPYWMGRYHELLTRPQVP